MIAGAFRPDEEHDMRADFIQLTKLAALKSKLERLGFRGVKSVTGKRRVIGDVALLLFGDMSKRENRDRLWRKGRFNYPGHDMRSAIVHRRFMRTKRGLIGLVPELAEAGDCIGVFEGGKVPLVLRPKGVDWELIGDSYVHGIIAGEAFVQENCKGFWLV
jgi:hypothetical protein